MLLHAELTVHLRRRVNLNAVIPRSLSTLPSADLNHAAPLKNLIAVRISTASKHRWQPGARARPRLSSGTHHPTKYSCISFLLYSASYTGNGYKALQMTTGIRPMRTCGRRRDPKRASSRNAGGAYRAAAACLAPPGGRTGRLTSSPEPPAPLVPAWQQRFRKRAQGAARAGMATPPASSVTFPLPMRNEIDSLRGPRVCA